MAGRPSIYTAEQRKKAIKNNQIRSYLKKAGRTEEEYNQWKAELALKKQINKLKHDFNKAIADQDPTKITVLTAVLSN